MNLGFADQFVPFVEDGTKTHSIRAGNRWKVGMRADCYARPRQKGMRLLFRAPVVRVERVVIRCTNEPPRDWDGPDAAPLHLRTSIEIEGCKLTDDELDLFAWRDGFRHPLSERHGKGYGSFFLMVDFWRRTHKFGKRVDMFRYETEGPAEDNFHGQIIHWDYAARCVAMAKRTLELVWKFEREGVA